jgi:REP-associated tyrosine transposase
VREDQGTRVVFLTVAILRHASAQPIRRGPLRILGDCVTPHRWHLVVLPPDRKDRRFSEFLRCLTFTHTQCRYSHCHTSGTGPGSQGRFQSFPAQSDEHLDTVLLSVERDRVKLALPRARR